MRPSFLLLVLLCVGLLVSSASLCGQEFASPDSPPENASTGSFTLQPVALLLVGILSVLGLIIGLKLNAFLALILSALIVSLLIGATGDQSSGARMDALTTAFGSSAKSVGIVIAMAAIIGKCMLDSGAADRIVRSAVNVTGDKKASYGLMLSSFVLAVPVFFDTVFYLLVPLARSLFRRTNKNYLRYLMAIATGGCITHTLVPPTPGPLLVSSILGVEIGMMMMVGALVAIPAAIAGIVFSIYVDHKSPVMMRPLGANENKHKPLLEDQLPSLGIALLPVILPVFLIGMGTLATTLADREDRAALSTADITDYKQLAELLREAEPQTPAARILRSERLTREQAESLTETATSDAQQSQVVSLLNEVLLDKDFYSEQAFLGVPISDTAKKGLAANQLRMKPVDRRRMNRALMEDAFGELIVKHQWDSPKRNFANALSLWSNPDFALLLAAICAMLTLKIVRTLSWRDLATDVEEALMSGGVIILITAAGGAFGVMLTETNISDTIRDAFANQRGVGITLLVLAWAISAVLKIAQGSSTVAMIIGAGMMSAIIGDSKPDYHLVYVATAVGSGSLMGSWMNDSGFWVFTKMGGLTEGESLRSWTPLLAVLSVVSLLATIFFSQILPLRAGS